MCCEETSENVRPGIKDESPRSFLERVGFRRIVPAVVALLFLLPGLIPVAQAEAVVTRKRIGNNSEGVTYVTTGQWKNRAVAIDGNDVLAINLGGPSENTDDSLTSSVSSPSTEALRGPATGCPGIGCSVQLFDSGAGPRIFTGGRSTTPQARYSILSTRLP